VHPSEDVEVDTLAGMFFIPTRPDVGDWYAVEEASNCKGSTVREADGQKNINPRSKFLTREDSKTETKKRHFSKCDSYKIKDLSQPGKLQLISRR
jgi:hypothetical protein